jgi:hypothetical protein
LATAFLASVAALTFVGWPHVEMPAPDPSDDQSLPSIAPTFDTIVHPVALDAQALTEPVVQSVEDGWALVEYDSSAGDLGVATVTAPSDPTGIAPSEDPVEDQGDGHPKGEIPGPRYLYVVDPGGLLYAAGDLGVATGIRLLAWLPDHRHAIVSEPAADGRVTLHAFDLVSGQMSAILPDANGTAGGAWVNPEVRVSTDGEGMLIAYGASERGIVRMGFDGSPLSTLVAPVEMGGFLQSMDGTTVVVVEKEQASGDDDGQWTIATYAEEVVVVSPSPSAAPTPVTSPSPAVQPGYGVFVRQSHGLPAGEEWCFPVSWAKERQLLNACPRDDGTVLLYTLAMRTSTYVDVAIAPARDGDMSLAFNADGTRMARGRSLLNVLGEELWRLNDQLPAPTSVVWSGEYLLAWGDDSAPPAPGYGANAIRARLGETGELVYAIYAVEGASGFHTVVTASATAD